VTTLTWGFVACALLLGIALALRDTAMYLSITGGENISFIAGTRFFQRKAVALGQSERSRPPVLVS
jgi:hypothetical protein